MMLMMLACGAAFLDRQAAFDAFVLRADAQSGSQ